MKEQYESDGFVHLINYFEEAELSALNEILEGFHQKWLIKESEFYKNGGINSHSLTSGDILSRDKVFKLFEFISQPKIQQIVDAIFPNQAKFLNTQLFFDPFKEEQNNYWHRDIQYTDVSEESQKEMIKTQNVLHCRIPLKKENGIELIPATHRQWDTEEELMVRKQLYGRKASDKLQRGKLIQLDRKDLLIFSANMIHRGIYGKNRLSFDIIFCDNIPSFTKYIDSRNLPTIAELNQLGNKNIY